MNYRGGYDQSLLSDFEREQLKLSHRLAANRHSGVSIFRYFGRNLPRENSYFELIL